MVKKQKFKILDKVTAEATFEAYGSKLDELFENCALALNETMVDTRQVKARMEKQIKLQNADLSALLIDFLNEIVYLKDAESMLFSKFSVKLDKKENGTYVLSAKIAGEPIDPKKHELRADVKSATYHMFRLEQKGKQYIAEIVLDV